MERLFIKTYEKQSKMFWQEMGEYFANRKFANEMGGWQFYSVDSAIWFILCDSLSNIVGFNSIIPKSNHLFFDNFYIKKKYRGKGYSNLLHEKRFEYAKLMNKEIRLICDNPIQIKKYNELGFEYYGNRGKYLKYRYNAK